jgi:hypothetical protein
MRPRLNHAAVIPGLAEAALELLLDTIDQILEEVSSLACRPISKDLNARPVKADPGIGETNRRERGRLSSFTALAR